MKTSDRKFAVSATWLAVQGALLAMCATPLVAVAQGDVDEEAQAYQAMMAPTQYVELGAEYVSKNSQKFGEYNGLDKSGGYVLGNFELQGGNALGMGGGTTRWDLYGTDLGTTSRELGGKVSNQGQWSLGLDFDQLRHYTTGGTYQTPYQGSMGGDVFILPNTFGVINTTATTNGTTGVITSASKGSQTLTPTQLAAFHTEKVYTERKNTSFSAGYNLNPQWDVKFDFKRIDQSGAKLIGSGTDVFAGGPGGFNYGGERVAILMNPTDYKTDTYNLALNWVGDKAHMSVSYFASLFDDANRGISWSNPWVSGGTGAAPNPPTGTDPGVAFPISTMSTPPDNEFHQLNLTGGYNISSATKLAGGLSYARNTQNDGYAGTFTTATPTVVSAPASLDGKVVTTHADLKLTHQATPDLGLIAGVKYNERDNKTASFSYTFLDLGGPSRTAVNIPMSNKHTQAELAGDYRIAPEQHLHVGYEFDQLKRWCNNSAANSAQGVLSATNAGYYTTASCVQVPKDEENRGVLSYRLRAADTVNFNAGYTYGRRRADVNPSFYNPMQSEQEGFEDFGYLAFFDASRTENLLKAGVNWQATNKVSVGLNGRTVWDDYDTTLGVQKGRTSSANLDTTYAYAPNYTVSAYLSWQKRTRDLYTANGRNAVSTAGLNYWSNSLSDEDNTAGIGAKQSKLMSGKLELAEDLTYSLSKSGYSTTAPYLTNNPATTVPNLLLGTGSSPDIKNELIQFKLSGSYQLNKPSKIVAGYTYQRLKSNDYYYNAYQYGFTPTSVMPTNQTAPSYTVNAVFAAYNYSFQ